MRLKLSVLFLISLLVSACGLVPAGTYVLPEGYSAEVKDDFGEVTHRVCVSYCPDEVTHTPFPSPTADTLPTPIPPPTFTPTALPPACTITAKVNVNARSEPVYPADNIVRTISAGEVLRKVWSYTEVSGVRWYKFELSTGYAWSVADYYNTNGYCASLPFESFP